MATMTYLEAIRDGLLTEMRRDPRVFVIGEDVGANGGAGIGAAVLGMRPVVELQFADFVSDAFTQVVNMAATFHWRTGCALPLVLRMPYGGGIKGGPFHSQCKEAWFVHTPGLKVVAPAFPE